MLDSEWQASRLYLSQEAAAGRNPDTAITWGGIAKASDRWREASASFSKAFHLATLVCDQEVTLAFHIVHGSMLQISMDTSQKPNALGEAHFKLISQMNDLTAAIRKELGIPMTPEELLRQTRARSTPLNSDNFGNNGNRPRRQHAPRRRFRILRDARC